MKQPHPSYYKTAAILTVIICLIAVICAAVILFLPFDRTGEALTADIYQDGELLESISLSQVTEDYTIPIGGESHHTNVVEVRPGEIGIISADCPDKLCVRQGFIHSSLLPITCLPNRLVIRLRQDTATPAPPKEPLPDIITY